MKTKIRNATIWSSATQIISKLISPLTNIILARLLLPETFGVIATVRIVISFTNIFTEAGFAKYLVQHEFKNIKEEKSNADVAFWLNLIISTSLWLLIVIFHHPIASIVGNPNLAHVLIIACAGLPINSLSSIQLALYTRKFNFKVIFVSSMISAITPLFITIPLAYFGFKHWAIIIGSMCGVIFGTILLTIKSDWKPSFFFSFKILREMLFFSLPSIIEGIFVWITGWIDIIIISNVFNGYYLGLYTIASNMVNAIISIITSALGPILFSTLSRLQNNPPLFQTVLLKSQKLIAYFLLPIGVGLYLYRETIVRIILGPNWSEASDILGILALTIAIKTVFVDVNHEAFKAVGRPIISLLLEMMDFLILVPVCIVSYKYGFHSLVIARSLCRFDLIIPNLILTSTIIKIKKIRIIKNITLPVFCTVLMIFTGMGLQLLNIKFWWKIVSIGICMIFYVIIIFLFDKDNMIQYINILNKEKN